MHPPASDLGAAGLSLGVVDVVPEGVESEEDILARIKRRCVDRIGEVGERGNVAAQVAPTPIGNGNKSRFFFKP